MTAATSLLLFFFLALIFSRILTPLVRMLGISLGAMDYPFGTESHTTPREIPSILTSGVRIRENINARKKNNNNEVAAVIF